MKQEILDVQLLGPEYNLSDFSIVDFQHVYEKAGHIITAPHRTDVYQILLVTQGQGTHWVDSIQYPYSKGTMISVAKGQLQVHDPAFATEGILLLFSDQYLYQQSSDMKWLHKLHLFNVYYPPFAMQLSNADYDEFLSIIEQIKDELTCESDFARDSILRNLLRLFILKAERIKRSYLNITQEADGDFSLFLSFRKALEKSFISCRCVKEYATYLSISPKKLNKICQHYLNKTAKQAIDERVIIEIKRQLLHTASTVKEIAYSTGFDELTNMIKFFKRHTGLTPFQFKISSE